MALPELKVCAWIFARGGSRGLPGKNLKELGGRTLIGHAVECARRSRYVRGIYVSTDSPEIADCARREGAEVPFLRPAELATDTAPEHAAWQHAVSWDREREGGARMDLMVSLPPTAPLRTAEEVDLGIELFLEGGADTVVAVSRSDRHPAFNMVSLAGDRSISLVMPRPPGVFRRQDTTPVYDIATAFYIVAPDFVLASGHYLEGRVKAVEIPREHAVDIDGPLDFRLCSLLMENRMATLERIR